MIIQAMPYPGGTIDPYWTSVVYLAGYDDFASVAAAEKDESSFNHTPINHGFNIGNLPNGSPGKFGAGCYRAIANCWVSYADSADWQLGSSPFTMEAWVQFTTAPSSSFHNLFGQRESSGNQRSFGLSVASNVLTLFRSADGATETNVTGAWTPSTLTWYHVAADFDGTKTRLYVDGVMKGSSTTAVTLFNSTADFTVGSWLTAGAFNSAFRGFLDEVRITKGVARYASDSGYTVPTAAFPRG